MVWRKFVLAETMEIQIQIIKKKILTSHSVTVGIKGFFFFLKKQEHIQIILWVSTNMKKLIAAVTQSSKQVICFQNNWNNQIPW